MRSFLDAKLMARQLRASLSDRGLSLSHSECLEIVARQFDCDDWNVLAAKIARSADGATAPAAWESIPVLRIFALDKATEFYVDFLGMTVDWQHQFEPNFPVYAQVSRGSFTLHLTEHHGDASPGSCVLVEMQGIEALQRELAAKQYRYAKPSIENAPWGAKVMQIADPFGNRLRFMEYVDEDRE